MNPLGVAVQVGVELRGSGDPVAAVTREVTLAGMTVVSPVRLAADQAVDFRLTGLSLNLDGRARILSCTEQGEGWLLALAFPEDLSLIERERLARFVVERRMRGG